MYFPLFIAGFFFGVVIIFLLEGIYAELKKSRKLKEHELKVKADELPG